MPPTDQYASTSLNGLFSTCLDVGRVKIGGGDAAVVNARVLTFEKQDCDQIFFEKVVEKPPLPEAPISITVMAYFKGFQVLITKRMGEGICAFLT